MSGSCDAQFAERLWETAATSEARYLVGLIVVNAVAVEFELWREFEFVVSKLGMAVVIMSAIGSLVFVLLYRP